jgi:glycerate kinase
MNILIAPNAFKGSLTATEAANCIAEGLRESQLNCSLTLAPIADGGDGTAALIAAKFKTQKIVTTVHNPLGDSISTGFWWMENEKTAVIEMADASGLRLVDTEKLNPLHSDSFGTGELIYSALDRCAQNIWIGLGGSATTDGGSGLLRALGVRFWDKEEREITDLPFGLTELESIDTSYLDRRLQTCKVTVLCDVKNNLLGKNGTASVFSPQKGANPSQVETLENCLQRFTEITKRSPGKDMSTLRFGGAAGGIAAGLSAFLDANLVSGIEFFLDSIGFDEYLKKADLVITAEGSLDAQTMEGKGPFGVAQRAKLKNIPVIALAGQVPLESGSKLRKYFHSILPINNAPNTIETAIKDTAINLRRTAFEVGKLLSVNKKK